MGFSSPEKIFVIEKMIRNGQESALTADQPHHISYASFLQ